MHEPFTMTELMDLLVDRLGLPDRHRTDREDLRLSDLGLDWLAFPHLQLVVLERLGVRLPDEQDRESTLGEIVGEVQRLLGTPPTALAPGDPSGLPSAA